MNEEIKNPNQLDLFEGILLSPEQEKQVASFIQRRKEQTEFRIGAVKQVESQLLAAGFIKGNHFVNDFKVETITTDVTLGYSYNNTQFTVELTYPNDTGDIRLKGTDLSLDKKQIEERLFYFNEHEGKFNCNYLQDNYRYVKAETLLQKLIENDEKVVRKFREAQKHVNLKQSVIEKYTKLYPNATITVKEGYSKYNGYFDVVEVRFESGSYVQFKLDCYKGVEYLVAKHDAGFEKLTSDELLERFSKQEALK